MKNEIRQAINEMCVRTRSIRKTNHKLERERTTDRNREIYNNNNNKKH